MNSKRKKYLLKTLANAFIQREAVVTTGARAKEVKPFVERLITLSKDSSIGSRRALLKTLGSEQSVNKLLSIVGPTMRERTGGYTRLLKMGVRKGDSADMVKVEFSEELKRFKGKKVKSDPKEASSGEVKAKEAAEKKEKDAKVNSKPKTKTNRKRMASN